MASLKQILITINLCVSLSPLANAQDNREKNLANVFFSEFINKYSSDSLISYSGTKYGYDLKNYKKVYLIRIDSTELNKRCKYDDNFIVDSNIYKSITPDDQPKYQIVDEFVEGQVNIYISNVCCLNSFGYVFVLNIYFNSSSYDKSNFMIPFYYSFNTGEFKKIEHFQYLSH